MASKDLQPQQQSFKASKSSDSDPKFTNINLTKNQKFCSKSTEPPKEKASQRHKDYPSHDAHVLPEKRGSSSRTGESDFLSPKFPQSFDAQKSDARSSRESRMLSQFNTSETSLGTHIDRYQEETTTNLIQLEISTTPSKSKQQSRHEDPLFCRNQEQVQPTETQIFDGSRKLLNPDEIIKANATQTINQKASDELIHTSPDIMYAEESAMDVDDDSEAEGFDIDKVPLQKETETESEPEEFDFDKVPEENVDEKDDESELGIDLSQYNDLKSLLVRATPADIYRRYQNFVKHLPDHLLPLSAEETSTIPCCTEFCNSSFSLDRVMRERMRLPTSCVTTHSLHYAILQCQFYLLKSCFIDDAFYFEICRFAVCPEFFRRVYIINQNRFDELCKQIILGYKEAVPHGNAGRRFERDSTLQRFAKIVMSVDKVAEPHPSGIGFLMPPGTTKVGILRDAGVYEAGKINPSREIKRFVPAILCRKSDSHTKCETCIKLDLLCQSDLLTPDQRQKAYNLKLSHRCNVNNERRDYANRNHKSRETNELVNVAHDAMSNELNKCPHLLQHRGKKLGDASKIKCGLSIALVHKKYKDMDTQVYCYWSPDQCNATNANSTVSQLLHTLSQLEVIPNNISFQLDNCAVNKNYTLFCSFGLLLKWVPQISKIYVCTSEVGHTHNDVDQRFGILAKALQRTEVFSPQGYMKFAEDTLKNVVSNNLIPVIYDFDSLVKPFNKPHGKINANHYFELSLDSEGKVICRIARFLRSQQYIINDTGAVDPSAFYIFKDDPDLEKFPAIIPPKALDKTKFKKFLNYLHGTIPADAYKELSEFPGLIENYPKPESFETLLNRIRSKVISTPASAPVEAEDMEDLDNQEIDAFLNSPEINKIWLTPTSLSSAQNSESSGSKKTSSRKRKTTTAHTEVETPSSSAQSSAKAARPKKTAIKKSLAAKPLVIPKSGRQRQDKNQAD